jgi:hypothetical protein
MAASYFGAGAGQSGSTQSALGGLVGLDSANDDDLEPRYYSDLINNKGNAYARLLRPRDLRNAYNEYNQLYRGNDALAQENANFYSDQARGILGDNTRTADTYERLRAGNLSSLSDVFKNVLDHGLAASKARMAAGGYGGSGPSAYDRILNSTMTASNLSPVLQTIYGNLGRDATSAIGGDRAWDSYRMGQFAQDPLTGYVDAATAGRVLNPLNAYRGMINQDVNSLGNILNNVVVPNVAGYDLIPGLGSRLNNVAAGFMNAYNFGSGAAGGFGGGGGGMGGMGGMSGMMGGMGGGGMGASQPATNMTPGNYYMPGYGTSPGISNPYMGSGMPATQAYV